MNRLRFRLSLLVGYFFGIVILLYGKLLFNYELISYFVVVLVCVLMCIDLVVKKHPGFSRNFLWLVAYVFYFIWLMGFDFNPISSNQSVYRIFTEIFVITFGLNLSSKISILMDEVQTIVEKVSFSMIKTPAQFDNLSSEIEKEVSRSIRYGRPLSLLVVDIAKDLSVKIKDDQLSNLQSEMVENYFQARVNQEIINLTRKVDIVTVTKTFGRFFILCPESDRRSIDYLGERILMMLEDKFDASMRWGGAEINDENTNFEKLNEAAERNMENRSLNASSPF
ncbi:MAG: hypothetical protein K8R40_13580 [Anaerolineaceae bacterium]|nr:hypothetical protein [Anaerolineaceae bacterium]